MAYGRTRRTAEFLEAKIAVVRISLSNMVYATRHKKLKVFTVVRN